MISSRLLYPYQKRKRIFTLWEIKQKYNILFFCLFVYIQQEYNKNVDSHFLKKLENVTFHEEKSSHWKQIQLELADNDFKQL